MTAVKIGVKIIYELKNFIQIVASQDRYLDKFRQSEKDFTRNRKLPFDRLVLMITKLCKKTLSIELEDFFKEMGDSLPCSVSAFTQQRIKLKSSFFISWNKVLWLSFYYYCQGKERRWKGLRVIAADGSNISLVKNTALSAHFGGQSNQHDSFVQAKTFYYYDVLNELVLFPRIEPYRYGELNMAYEGINQLESDMLAIYDRNFCCYKMFALHLWAEQEIKFVIRAKEHMNVVRAFIQSKQYSAVIELFPSKDAIKGLYDCGFIVTKGTPLKIRLVRVDLPDKVEVLATNLWEEEGHSSQEFKDIYHLRWKIETNISTQKNIMQLESFSGLTIESVEQDFYATVLMINLHSVLIKEAQDTLDQQKTKYKYPMKVNMNKSFGKLKNVMVSLFLEEDPSEIINVLNAHFIKDTLPIRKNRSFERIRKNKPGKSKYRTYTNFKPAY